MLRMGFGPSEFRFSLSPPNSEEPPKDWDAPKEPKDEPELSELDHGSEAGADCAGAALTGAEAPP